MNLYFHVSILQDADVKKNTDVCLGPVIDNLYVPDLPGVLLSKGNYNKSVKIIAAYNSNEGAVFNPVSYASTVLRLKHQANICRTSPVTIFSTSMSKIYFRMQVRQSWDMWTKRYTLLCMTAATTTPTLLTAEACLSANSSSFAMLATLSKHSPPQMNTSSAYLQVTMEWMYRIHTSHRPMMQCLTTHWLKFCNATSQISPRLEIRMGTAHQFFRSMRMALLKIWIWHSLIRLVYVIHLLFCCESDTKSNILSSL